MEHLLILALPRSILSQDLLPQELLLLEFQAVNHGMSTSFLDEVHQVTRNFFELPLEEKKKYSKSAYDFEGFGNNAVYKENPTLGWNDRLYLHVLPESSRKSEKWPQNPENLR